MHNFVANENLYNKLYSFSVDLTEYVPTVRVEKGRPLAKRIQKKSNEALRSLVNALVELLFDTKPKKDKKQPETIITALEQLFAQYDPTAKEIREEEAKKAKEALKKRSRFPFRLRDKPQRDDYDDYDDYDYYDEDDYYPRRHISGSRPVGGRRRTGRGPAKPRNGQKPGAPTKKPTKKPTDGKAVQKEKKEFKKDRALNRFVKSLEAALTVVVDLIDEHPKLKDLRAYVKAKKFDSTLEKSHIPDVYRNLTKATSKLKSIEERLKSKQLSTETKNGYINEVKAFIQESKEYIISHLGFNTEYDLQILASCGGCDIISPKPLRYIPNVYCKIEKNTTKCTVRGSTGPN